MQQNTEKETFIGIDDMIWLFIHLQNESHFVEGKSWSALVLASIRGFSGLSKA